jgi:hypothetical protein
MFVRSLLVCGVFLSGLMVTAVQAAKPAKPGKGTVGEVVAVERAEDGTGTITIKEGGKKKKDADAAAPAAEKKFKVSKDTKFEKVAKKADAQPATFADVEKGARVAITAKEDVAEKVQIRAAKKKAAK